jgi:phosphoribosyl 1,2-cyclic phosphodiesterase
VRIDFLGVRGSTPAPGAAFLRYGGHTSCIAVAADDGGPPTLILDAGTGLRDLAALLGGSAFTGSILLSHLHWDHVHGLPFSTATNRADASVELIVPTDGDPLTDLMRGFSPPHFPVSPDQLAGRWLFARMTNSFAAEGFSVRTARVRHKGGPTVGLRLARGSSSLAYLPDHDLSDPDPDAVESARGVDVLIHDGQFVIREIAPYVEFGHSSIERALAFADEAEVGRVILTHHAPDRTDEQLDALAEEFPTTAMGRPVTFAAQGMTVLL